MKFLLVLSVAIAAVTANTLPPIAGPYDYHRKYGIPAAEALRNAEAARRTSRIVGGELARKEGIEYQCGLSVVLQSGWLSTCGATLLTNTKSVTAAHCWNDGWSQAVIFNMVFGSANLHGSDGTRMPSNNVYMHENWDIFSIANDIAMITHDRVEFTEFIQPAALPTGDLREEDFAGEIGLASGYGLTSNNPPVPNPVLSYVYLPIMSNAACRNVLGSAVINSTICTDGSGFKNICSGDSGGPLVVFWDRRPILVGVVSFGSANCVNDSPAGYARITSYLDWVQYLLTT